MSHHLKGVIVTRDEKAWEVEVAAEIPAEALAEYREETLKEMQRDAKLDGFRPGKAPIERIIAIYGEPTILRHAAQHAIEHELPELLAGENVLIIEAPRVTTESPEAGKPLKFTARAAMPPKIEIKNYKKIAAKHANKEEVVVSDDEHQEALTHLRRERARIDKVESGTDAQKAAEEVKAMTEGDLPALDDAFVQSLGYENAEKFSEALRGNIKTEKEMQAREKRRAAILDDLVKEATINYPASLREYELGDMEARLTDDLSRMGMTMDGYLTQVKKTREQLREEWKDAADKRARVRLVLAEIANQEKIEPDEKALQHEFDHAKKHYPQTDEQALRAHIAHAMRNDATLRFLEGDTSPVPLSEHNHAH
jgi:FKBP-type peptidyl-prolyl cis-trans isomerase (trigger factor)